MRNLLLLGVIVGLVACQWQEPRSAFGTVERDVLLINAASAGVITDVKVKKGEQVQAGQLLVQQETTEQKLQVAQVQAGLAAAQAELELLQLGSRSEQRALARANLARAEAKLADARLTQQRQAELLRQQLNTEAAVQQADAALAIALAEQQAAQQQLTETLAGNRQQEIESAKQQEVQLQARLKQLQWQLLQQSTYAERDGVIDDVLRYRGERVQAGNTLLTLAVAGSAYARLYLPASALANWPLGQQVSVWPEGRDAAVIGTVRYISTVAAFTPHFALHQQERSRLVYLTEISLPDESALSSGTPVRVELP
ncbi:HlyD family secretion protein [Rheinheimera sp. NSM]|uniref:HlyD family secretion protein n=1 Tax=Rheinheimera sp. NSM TaxID=3457884 RepID=UPI004035D015